MNVLTNTVARIFYSIPFFVSGIMHLLNAKMMAGYVPLPGGEFWVYFTGVALFLAGISIITKYQGKLAMFLLAALLLIFIFTMQVPMLLKPETIQMGLAGTLKDTGLMGGALLLAGILDREQKLKTQKI